MKQIFAIIGLLINSNLSSEILSVNVKPYTEHDKIIMLTLLAEAAGEGQNGMLAVAAVIKRRGDIAKIPYHKICLKPKQFSCWNDKNIDYLFNKWIKSKNARIALTIAQNINSINTNDFHNVDHYHTLSCNPYWKDKTKQKIIIGNHVFYKLK